MIAGSSRQPDSSVHRVFVHQQVVEHDDIAVVYVIVAATVAP
jgi:hypothetical protein